MPKYKKVVRQGRAKVALMIKARRVKKTGQNSHDEIPTTSEDILQNYFDSTTQEILPPDLPNTKDTEAINNLDIEEFQFSYDEEAESGEKTINRRIIDVSHFISELKRFSNHGPLGCGFTELELIAETQIGLQSIPITAFKFGLDEAIKKRKVTFWKTTQNGLEINKNHQWYYQVQGQLHITNKSKCLFAVWSNQNSPLKIEYIFRNDIFWKEKMKDKLVSFYVDCLLPELVDPRYPRGMAIRNPTYIEEALVKQKKAKKMLLLN